MFFDLVGLAGRLNGLGAVSKAFVQIVIVRSPLTFALETHDSVTPTPSNYISFRLG